MTCSDLLSSPKYVISLPYRADRRATFIQSAAKAGIKNYKWFVGVDGRDILYRGKLKPGQLGCKLSHIEAIKQARANHYPQVMIIEDDALFSISDYSRSIQIPDDWDVFYLGANNYKPLEMIGPHVGICKASLSTVCYVIKAICYDMIIDLLEEDKVLDIIYVEQLQKIARCYCFVPSLVKQSRGFSDVENRVVNYDKYYL